ncbi:phage portal protein [Clostridium perfringens]|uniref:HK97 family phage portal protein n=2 Tax=Clostridium perfringens TaxID=1502 RepID=A0AAV3FE77_CLOPF|nr:phage portal protein [Clostridium perfringens]EIA17586.1 HK97 family phage portal protein [Clostridium perfringens F262]MCX0402876.1 phage portal protein [Clostridium perfringens]MDK0607909.1 phage portal protein [Clostridium perfringens]MDM0592794.1 phage portal protein [Clostridium perfringens]MDM0595793.1 phage portal protein [Clostridium perfringens]
MGIFSKIIGFFKTPYKAYINRDFSNFSFFNRDLNTNENIFSAVSLLSNALASAPISVYKDYEKLKPRENDLARLFEYGPNNFQSTFQFIRLMETLRNTKGAAYAIKEYGFNNRLERLWVMNPDNVTPQMEKDSRELYYAISKDGAINYVHSSHIIAVNYVTTDGYTPISPLDVLRNTVDYDREIKEFSLNQMKDGLKANLVIKLQAKLNKEELDNYNEMINRFKSNGILYVDNGKEFQELKKSSFIDPNVAAVEEITVERVERVYTIQGKLTGKATNVEDLLYLKDSILPTARMYEQEFTKKCIPNTERDEGIKVKISLNGFARADMKTRGEFYFKGVRTGWFCPDEVRALEDMPPIKGGDTYYVSKDLIPVDMIRNLNKPKNK